jgi:hypothetical protein
LTSYDQANAGTPGSLIAGFSLNSGSEARGCAPMGGAFTP